MGDLNQRVVGTEYGEDLGEDLEFVLYAAEAGYFDVPRETPLINLAEAEDISDTEATERIRRGVKELIASRTDQE